MNPEPNALGTYSIPDRNIDKLEAQLAKLNKRAKKLGVTPVTLTRNGFVDVPHDCGPNRTCAETGQPTPICHKRGTIARTWEIVVHGETPKYAGWEFVATIEHTGDENIVRIVPGSTLPLDYRTADRACDQCQLVRNRRDTYVVRNGSDFKQVGSDCLKDFLGHQNPQSLAAWAEALGAFATDLSDAGEYGWSDGSDRYIDGEEFLTHVAAVIRVRGWRSRTRARNEGGVATADQAIDNMFPAKGDREKGLVLDVEPVDVDRAIAAMAWAENVLHEIDDSELNDYLHNLRAVTKSRAIEQKHTGLFASLIPTAEREGEKAERIEREKSEQATRVHVGTVGKREVFKSLTVKRITEREGDYGLTTIITFADPDGNSLVWFKSGSIDSFVPGYQPGQRYAFSGEIQGHYESQFEVDRTYDLKATVKKHNGDDRYGPQTVLSRAVIVKTHQEVCA